MTRRIVSLALAAFAFCACAQQAAYDLTEHLGCCYGIDGASTITEAMSKTTRNKELKTNRTFDVRQLIAEDLRSQFLSDTSSGFVVTGKETSHMLSVSRTASANIHSHVEHGATHTSNQLALSIRRALEMQATHDAISRHRLIVLHEFESLSQFLPYLSI